MAVDINELIEQYEQQRAQANQANEQRYDELLELLSGLQNRRGTVYDDVIGTIAAGGQTARRNAKRRGTVERGAAEQDLISRGLGNTTVRSSVMRGINRDTTDLLNQIAERQAMQTAQAQERSFGAETNTTRMLAGAIEGRQDVGPSMSQYARLIQQAAAAGDPDEKLTARVGVRGNAWQRGGGFSARTGAGGGGSGGGPSFGERGGGGSGGGNRARLVAGPDPSRGSPSISGIPDISKLPGEGPSGGLASKLKKKKKPSASALATSSDRGLPPILPGIMGSIGGMRYSSWDVYNQAQV